MVAISVSKHLVAKLYLVPVAAYFFSRVFFLNWRGPILSVDSDGYRASQEGFLGASGLSKIDFLGDSFRPWPVNLLYALQPDDTARIFVQILSATIAFYVWSKFLYISSNSNRQKNLTIGLLISFAVSPTWICIDLNILPESYSNTFLLLGMYFFVNSFLPTRKIQVKNLVLSLFLISLFAIQRPSGFIFILALALIVSRLNYSNFTKIIATLVILISALSFLQYHDRVRNDGSAPFFQTTYPVQAIAFPYGLLVYKDHPTHKQWLEYFIQRGAPKCAQTFLPGEGPYEFSTRISGECSQGAKWVKDSLSISLYVAPIKRPALVTRDFFHSIPRLFWPTPDFYLAQDLLNLRYLPVFPDIGAINPSAGGTNYIYAWNMFLFFIFFSLISIAMSKGLKRPFDAFYILVLQMFLLLSMLATNYVMPSDIFRHSSPQFFGVLFTSILLVIRSLRRESSE